VPRVPRIHDISLAITPATVVYPGNPGVVITPHQAIARGDSANVSAVSFGSHTGTHVDAPKHFNDAANGVDEIAIERLIGPATVVEFDDSVRSIGRDELGRAGMRGTKRLLLKTRNSRLLNKREFRADYTFLAPEGAELLVESGVELVGIDYLSIEQFKSGHHRTHLTLLQRGVVILEGLDLSAVAPGEYELLCLPLRLAGLDGAPARAILRERSPSRSRIAQE
jgi:arylformamidase